MKKTFESPWQRPIENKKRVQDLLKVNKICRFFPIFTKVNVLGVSRLVCLTMGVVIFFSLKNANAFDLDRPSLKSLKEPGYKKFNDYYSYFEHQCHQRTAEKVGKGNFHDDCLLFQLLDAYSDNSFRLKGTFVDESLVEKRFDTRDDWTTADLLAGFFNEKFVLDEDGDGIKPLVNRILLEVAIRKELVKFKEFLETKAHSGVWPLKRYYFPEMMAHFSGHSALARANAYAESIDCDVALRCDENNPDCGPSIQKECRDAKSALDHIVSQTVRGNIDEINAMLGDFRVAAQNSLFTPSQVIFDSHENAKTLFENIESRISGETILEWVKGQEFCEYREEENPLHALCTKIEDSTLYPKEVNNKQIANAVLGSVILTEAQKLAHLANRETKMPDVAQYPKLEKFVAEAERDILLEFGESIGAISEHFYEYDPSQFKPDQQPEPILPSGGSGQLPTVNPQPSVDNSNVPTS